MKTLCKMGLHDWRLFHPEPDSPIEGDIILCARCGSVRNSELRILLPADGSQNKLPKWRK